MHIETKISIWKVVVVGDEKVNLKEVTGGQASIGAIRERVNMAFIGLYGSWVQMGE